MKLYNKLYMSLQSFTLHISTTLYTTLHKLLQNTYAKLYKTIKHSPKLDKT